MAKEVLKVKRLSRTAELPSYSMGSDLGFDLRADESVTLAPYEQKAVKTGIAIQIPEKFIGLIRDRAGIVTKMGVHTAAGTFDPAFRGEITVVLINFGEQTIQVEKGMRIAQMIILPVAKPSIQEVKSLPITERYDRGFLSTGLNEKEILKKEKKFFRLRSKK
ncbi:MAG: dUTP diphosphatase [archaeon]